MMCAAAISSIFGPLLFILGVWSLLIQKDYYKALEEAKKSTAILHMGGFLNLLIGLTIVHVCPNWALDQTIFITILGWVLIVRGLCVFFAPKAILWLFKLSSGWHLALSFIVILWGLILCRVAFSAM
ncbi:MAG: hypothetical protein KBC64_03235 [Simkaniaceae bacterium]|nr:hypothetical protein [Simkaniaceae bacterium]